MITSPLAISSEASSLVGIYWWVTSPKIFLPHLFLIPRFFPFSVTLSLQLMQFRRLLPNISSLIIQHGKTKVWRYRTKIVPAFSKIITYLAKIKIWLVSQLDWTKFDTEQLQVTGKSDDNASLLLLKSKMVLILFLQKIGYGASVAVLTLVMLSLSLLFSGPAQNSDTVQKSFTLHFKYFDSRYPAQWDIMSSSWGDTCQLATPSCGTYAQRKILLKAEWLHHWMVSRAFSSCISTRPICNKLLYC